MLRSVKSKVLSNVGRNIKFPERFKGTFLEKWADYWKNLVIDYRQMVLDLRTDIQDNPVKAFKYTVGLTSVVLLARNNPTETDYRDTLQTVTNELILLSEDTRNPVSLKHLNDVYTCINEDVIHYQNLGIFSLMYKSKYNDSCSSYKTQCSYIKPHWYCFPAKIIDIGLMGRWWNLHIKMTNYDVNLM